MRVYVEVVVKVAMCFENKTALSDWIMPKLHTMLLRSKSERKKYCHQLLGAVHHCHQHGVMHCDVAPQNCMLRGTGEKTDRIIHPDVDPGLPLFNLALIDFGNACMLKDDVPIVDKGGETEGFMAPEGTGKDEHERGRTRTKATDVFSCGVLLREWIFSSREGVNFSYYHTIEDVDDPNLYPPWHEALSENDELFDDEDERDLLLSLVQPNPERRIPLDQALQHPYCTRN